MRIDRAVAAGQNVRVAGEDVTAGQVVLPAGTVLGPAQVGLAAAVGAGSLAVRRRPRVLVLSTGSELVAPGEPLRHGQIHESNGPMLAAAVTDAGAVAELLRFVPDDVEQFLGTLDEALAARADDPVDLVLTSGGVSAGAYEVVKDAFTGPWDHVRQGGDAAGHAPGPRAPPRSDGRRRGGDAAGQPGQLAGVVRGLRPAGPARRVRPPAARPPARAGPPGRAPGLPARAPPVPSRTPERRRRAR